MNGWKADKRWSDKFLPEIKQILGLYLIGEPPIEEDQERNTDLIVLKMDPLRVACRIRKYEYYTKYPNDITVRAGRPSGAKTELTKVIEGWGQYMFYGFSSLDEEHLLSWRLVDLREFRLWCFRYMAKHDGKLPGKEMNNHDGSSWFQVFNLTEAPEQIVYKRTEL